MDKTPPYQPAGKIAGPLSFPVGNSGNRSGLIARERTREIFYALGRGAQPSDGEFDMLFSEGTRRLSSDHWSPVRVAICAAEMLVTGPGSEVLDIGCGSGKFCLIGAATQAARFTGIDQRTHLLSEAKAIAGSASISNVEFIHGNMMDLDWSRYNAFYLYNPFLENMCMPAIIDDTVPLKPELFFLYVEAVQQKLMALPVGTRVVTYHGFGGSMPFGYVMVESTGIGSDYLQCWVKKSDCVVLAGPSRALVWGA